MKSNLQDKEKRKGTVSHLQYRPTKGSVYWHEVGTWWSNFLGIIILR